MATGNNAQEAAEEQQRRERERKRHQPMLDALPGDEAIARDDVGTSPNVNEADLIRGAGYGASGILGDIP